MKLYLIVAAALSPRKKAAMVKFLRPFRSKIELSESCWLIAAGSTSAKLCQEIQDLLGSSHAVIVSKWNGDSAWARGSNLLSEWLPKRLASLNY